MQTAPDNTIEASAIYSIGEFQRRTGLKKKALTAARRRGLKVRRAGRRLFVCGADFRDFLASGTAEAN